MDRVYLDWNATAPLRPEARAAMLAAMDLVGNPSSVHAEGRAAKALVEKARRQVAAAAGAEPGEVVFTSGATEAAALALAGRGFVCADIEHDAVAAWCAASIPVDAAGLVALAEPGGATVQLANSETGVVQPLPEGLAVTDATQGLGKIPFAFGWSGVETALISAHKLGGPKGVGALLVKGGREIDPRIRGWADSIVAGASEMNAIVENMLTYGSPERLVLETIEPEALLREAPTDRKLLTALRERHVELRGP